MKASRLRLIASFLFVISLHATTWYVRGDAACANNGDGTTAGCASPAGTAGGWKGSGNIAWGSIAAGDTINLVSGDTYTTEFNFGASGATNNYVTISVSGGGTATIDMTGQSINSAAFRPNGHSWVAVDGLRGQASIGNTTYGIKVINVPGNTWCGYESAGGQHIRFWHIDCSGSGQNNDAGDSSTGLFGAACDGCASYVDVGYSWVHPDASISADCPVLSASRSGSTATITCNGTHTWQVGQLVRTKGICGNYDAGGYNGNDGGPGNNPRLFTITGVTSTTVTFTLVETPATSCGAGGWVGFRWWATATRIFAGTQTTNFDDNVIHHNLAVDLYHDGYGCGANCSVYSNVAKFLDGEGHTDSVEMQSASYQSVYSNYIENSGDQNIYFDEVYGGTVAVPPSGVKCSHFRIYNNVMNSLPGLGIIVDPEASFNGPAPASVSCPTITTGAQIDDIVIANNTCYGISTTCVRLGRGTSPGVTNAVIKNNILGTYALISGYTALDLFNGGTFSFLDANAWDYDVFQTAATASNISGATDSLSYLQTTGFPSMTLREVHGTSGTVTYVNASAADFHLSPSDTAATGKGVNLTSTYSYLTTDAAGVTRSPSLAWDLGAFAATASSSPTARSIGTVTLKGQSKMK